MKYAFVSVYLAVFLLAMKYGDRLEDAVLKRLER